MKRILYFCMFVCLAIVVLVGALLRDQKTMSKAPQEKPVMAKPLSYEETMKKFEEEDRRIYGPQINELIRRVEEGIENQDFYLYKGQPSEDERILNLGRARDPKAVPVLLRVLKEYKKSQGVRYDAMKALEAIHDVSCIPVLRSMLYDGKEDLRESAADTLATFKESQEDARKYALSGVHPMVTIRILEKIGDIRAKEFISNMSKNNSEEIKERAGFALSNLGEKPQAFSIFSGLVKNTQNPDIKRRALRGLADLKDEQSIDILVNTLTDKDETVRNTALHFLNCLARYERNKFAIQSLQHVVNEKK